MLWRLQNLRGAAEARCVCPEVAPGEFRLVVACAGAAEVERIIVGVDEVLSWSDRLPNALEAQEWRTVEDLTHRRAPTSNGRSAPTIGDPVYSRVRRERADR